MEWHIRFAAISKGLTETSDVKSTTCLRLLLIQRRSLGMCLFSYRLACEMRYDAHTPYFTHIVEMAPANLETGVTSYTADSRFEPSHLFSMAMVQPLFLAACKCWEPLLGRRAVVGLEIIDGPSLYDTRMMAQVAPWAIPMEDKALQIPPGSISRKNDMVHEENRLYNLGLEFGPTSGACQFTAWKRLGVTWLKMPGDVRVG